MALSVIVTSYNSPAVLERCLDSLTRQSEASEIVVADCSPMDPAALLGAKFPRVRFLHFSEKRIVPAMRWAALRETSGEIVAAVEARCIPSADWCAQIGKAHAEHRDAPAVGGPVRIAEPATRFDRALYLCEYGEFAPPVASGWVKAISGANLSYKRAALDRERDLLEAGAWETLIHLRWERLWMSQASITFVNTMTPATALRQRFWYGRGYAAARVQDARRFAYACLTPVLPLLLMWRLLRKRGLREVAGALPWIAILTAAWSLGELCGYLFGEPAEARIF